MAISIETNRAMQPRQHPLLGLEEEDLDFIVQFVLASGSLKEMAERYGVSYPTIRASLDGVIGRLRQRLDGEERDEMTELLAELMERGELTAGVAKKIRKLHRSLRQRQEENA
jgi:hypothetical protein